MTAHDQLTRADHELVWTFDRDTVTVKAVCHAAPDADCRLACNDDCELYTEIHRSEEQAFDGDIVKRYAHDDCEAGLTPGDCNVCLFLNESDYYDVVEGAVGKPAFVIGRTPFKPVWQGDYFDWRPIDGSE